MNTALKKVSRFETHHRILFFVAVLVATVVILRTGIQFWNPNPTFLGFELHHFDYGVMLLLLASKFLLFGSERYKNWYLVLAAVGTAFVIDGYFALRFSVVENHDAQVTLYNSTIGFVILSLILVTLLALFIRSLLSKRAILSKHN